MYCFVLGMPLCNCGTLPLSRAVVVLLLAVLTFWAVVCCMVWAATVPTNVGEAV